MPISSGILIRKSDSKRFKVVGNKLHKSQIVTEIIEIVDNGFQFVESMDLTDREISSGFIVEVE